MQARVLRVTHSLVNSFSPGTGRWLTPTGEAWQPAIAVEAMLLAYERTGDVVYLNVVEKSFARYAGRRSRFFDDDGWYLNAWLRAYELDEVLPWDIVDNGVSKAYYLRELDKSRKEQLSPHCPELQGCIRCGVCVETPNPSYRLPEKWKALGMPPQYLKTAVPS